MADVARRRRGSAARRTTRSAVTFDVAPTIAREIPTLDILHDEAMAIIEHNADTVLEEIGVNFLDNPGALERWQAAGAMAPGECG